MSDCRACWICGRSVLGVRIYEAVPELCRPVDIWHGSRTLRYGLWRSWGRSAWSTGWGDSFKVFSFIFLSPNAPVCLCLQFSDRCRHICPTCVRKLGPLLMLLIRRKTVYKRLAEWNAKRCASNNEVVLCKFSIHQHCKLIMKNKKKFQRKDKKKKETLKFFYSSERNSSGLCVVAGTQWHQTNELTVVLSLSAWELSSKVQNLKKKSKKDTMQQGRKAKKKWKNKCYYSSKAKPEGLCIVAGIQWHHTNELTVVLSSKVQIWKKK